MSAYCVIMVNQVESLPFETEYVRFGETPSPEYGGNGEWNVCACMSVIKIFISKCEPTLE